MATKGLKISQMEEKLTLEGTEYIPIVDGSDNKKVKTDKLLTKEEAVDSYQEKLVSGTNIKTINGKSLVGEGNIEITGEGSSIADAPADNELYARKNNNWEKIEIPDTSNLATKDELSSKLDTTTYEADKEGFATKSEIPDVSDMLTKTEAGNLYQAKGNYLVESDLEDYITTEDLEILNDYATKTDLEGYATVSELESKLDTETYNTDKATFALKTEIPDTSDMLTKTEAGNTYQIKGDYALKSEIPTVPTKLSELTNDSNFQTEEDVNQIVENVIGTAPEALDTLKELADALGNDPNFATTITTELGKKVDKESYNEDKATFLTKTEAAEDYQVKGEYALSSDLETKLDTNTYNADKAGFATKTELENYQEKLVSGTNIKTINGQSLVGSGNVEISGGETSGIQEAPADGKIYGRKDNNWEEVVIPDTSNFATKAELADKLDVETYNQDKESFLTEIPSEYLTETEANGLYQAKGDYALASDIPTVPTKVSELSNDSGYQTSSDVDNRVQEIIGTAPEALDTLKELADALNNDPNFASTITTELGKKVDKIEGKQLSTEDYTTAEKEKLAGIDTSIYAKNEDLVYIADTVIPQMNENTAKALDQKVDWDEEKKVISLPSDGSISALRNAETLEGGVLLAQRTYDDGASYVTEVGTTKNKLTLNATERPQIDIQGGSSEKIAYESDLRTIPLEINLPSAVIRGNINKTYTQEEILGWFGFEEVADLKTAIVSDGLMYIRFGIQLSGNPYYYRMPVQYCAFESANQVKIVSIGLDTTNDKPNKITIVFNLDGTLIDEVSNVEVTFDELGNNETVDLSEYLTKEDASNTYQVKGNYALKSEIPDIMSVGMYYPGVKVDSQKLFALTKESTEDDIKAALQIAVSSGSYTLPTAKILDDCLGKGYQLLSNWMPVSIAWNGVAYVFYTVGQNYMMKPSGLYTVAISISEEGNYSVFQAGKVEEFADVNDIPEAITKVSELENDSNYQTEEEVDNKIGEVGIYDLGNFDSLDAASERACNGGIYDNVKYRFLKFTVNNKKTGLIINGVDDYKTKQYLYYDMYRYSRNFSRVEDTAYVTDWVLDGENTVPGKGVVSSKLFSLTADSTSEDIQAALTYPNGDGVLTSKDLDLCINNSLLLRDSDTSSLVAVGRTNVNSYYTFVYVGFDLVNSPSVSTIKDPNIKSVILNITSAGQYSVFRAATNKEIVTKDWDKLPYESIVSVAYMYSDKIYSEKSILGWFDCDTVEELKEKARQTVLFNMNYLNSADKFVRIPVQYIEFKNNDNQIHLSTIGLTIFGEEPVKYSITANLDGTIITGNSNVEVLKESLVPEIINTPYEINLTNLLSAEDSNAISEAIGGIDNLRDIVNTNRMIVGIINNGNVSVSIRILGQTTTLYYILDTVAGYTVNEINIVNTDGTLSKTIKSHSMMTEEMVVDNLTSSESTLPLSANQGKVLKNEIDIISDRAATKINITDMLYSTGQLRDPLDSARVNSLIMYAHGPYLVVFRPIGVNADLWGYVHCYDSYLTINSIPYADNQGNIRQHIYRVDISEDGSGKTVETDELIKSDDDLTKTEADNLYQAKGNYATEADVQAKQDVLVSGVNIKTVNGASLLGEGNIEFNTESSTITDAPIDGKYYVRKDGSWTEMPTTSTIDGGTYSDSTPEIQTLSNTFALKSAIPTKVSELENDSIYVTDGELEEKLENKVTGVGVNKIEVVTTLPEVQEDGVLYIVIG